MNLHVLPIPIPPPTSLPTPSLWVFPVHRPWALVSCIQPGLVICFTLIIYMFWCCSLKTSHPCLLPDVREFLKNYEPCSLTPTNVFPSQAFQNSKGVPNSEKCSGNKTTVSTESYFVLSEVTEGYGLSVFTIVFLFTLDIAQKRLGTRSMQWKDGWSYSFLFSQVPYTTSHYYFKKTKRNAQIIALHSWKQISSLWNRILKSFSSFYPFLSDEK